MQKCFQTNNFNVRTKWSLANLSRAIFAARISLWRKLETKVLTLNFGIYIIPHKKRFLPRESSFYQALRHWSSYCNIQNSTLTCHNRQLNERLVFLFLILSHLAEGGESAVHRLVGWFVHQARVRPDKRISNLKDQPAYVPLFVDWFELSSLQMFW